MAGLNLNLNAITENASRLGARIQESITEHTRDLAINRGQGSAYFDVPEEKVRNVRKQLDSSSDREKLDALKTLVALISKGRNVSEYFPYVVKNVASQNLEIRKLVYIFLLRYAESDPDLALLSINTFQKDLTDPNPLIRAMALRVLSGINVPMISNIVLLAIKKCASDPSPYVRKASALAMIKCFNLDASHLPSLFPILETLLRDRSSLSIGSVAIAFQTICPTRLDLLHKHYRRLCRMLVDADSWGQVSILDILSRYARSMLPRPTQLSEVGEPKEDVDPDLQLLLSSAEPLFMSNNPAVVVEAIRTFFYLGPQSARAKIVKPLLRLLHISAEVERVALSYLAVVTRESPNEGLFASHYSRFLVKSTDSSPTKRAKMSIMLGIINEENYRSLLREFIVYTEDTDELLVSDAVGGIGHIAKVVPHSIPHCLSALMGFIKYGSEHAIAASVLVLKALVQAHPSNHGDNLAGASHTRIIADLASHIDEIRHASARACVVWLVGQYASASSDYNASNIPGVTPWAPDVLRRVAKTFVHEEQIVKLQLVTLASKLLVLAPDNSPIGLLARFVFSMARYDNNFDVRDRARMLSSLLSGVSPNLPLQNGNTDLGDAEDALIRGGVVLRKEQVKVVLFEGKLDDVLEKTSSSEFPRNLGSLDLVIGKSMGLYSGRQLPDWPDEGTDSSLRDVEEEYSSAPALPQVRAMVDGLGSGKPVSPVVLTPTGGASPMGSLPGQGLASKGPWMDLDKFLEDAGDEEEDAEEDNTDSTEESDDVALSGRPRHSGDASRHVGHTRSWSSDTKDEDEESDPDDSDSSEG